MTRSDLEKRVREPARQLARNYQAITLGGAFALLFLVTVLFFLQFKDLERKELTRVDERLKDRGETLDSFLRNTSFYIHQLRNTTQYHLRNQGAPAADSVLKLIKNYENNRFFALDDIPTDAHKEDLGNLFGLGSFEERMAANPLEVKTALSLFPLFKATHQSLSQITASYYQGENLTAMFPWAPTSTYLETEEGLTIERLLQSVTNMELYQQGRPENNPTRRNYWTQVYLDPAGQGSMVTHGAPIYHDDQFLGVVATDITLGDLHKYVDGMNYKSGLMFVVNGFDQVLATSLGVKKDLKPLDELLPPSLRAHAGNLLTTEKRLLGDHIIFKHKLEAAPWTLIYLIPKKELNKLSFFAIVGYAAIVLGLCLFLIMVYILLQRRFVKPALALTDHIRAEALDGHSHVGDIPKVWRPWFETVTDTFALRHVTANIPGAVYQLKQVADERKGKPYYHLIFVSNGIAELTDVPASELMERSDGWHQLFYPEDVPEMQKALEESALTMGHFQIMSPIRTQSGERRWARFASNPRKNEEGEVIWEGLILDITQRKEAQEALEASELRLRSIMDASLFPLVVTEMDKDRVCFINDRALALFEIPEMDLANLKPSQYWVKSESRNEIMKTIEAKGKVENAEVQLKRRNGESFWVLMSAMAMIYENKPSLLFTYTDISRQKELETELKKLATTDPLTGAFNRRHFMTLGEREWERARRGLNPLSVMMLDIDYFKKINDTYGHPAGDEVLRRVVELIKTQVRNVDVFGRLGGEEFAAVLPNTDLDTALMIGDRLRGAIEEMAVIWEDQTIVFTMSIGVAQFEDQEDTLEALMGKADQALYGAKTTGRNRVLAYQEQAR